jgi:hypothetical protein
VNVALPLALFNFLLDVLQNAPSIRPRDDFGRDEQALLFALLDGFFDRVTGACVGHMRLLQALHRAEVVVAVAHVSNEEEVHSVISSPSFLKRHVIGLLNGINIATET